MSTETPETIAELVEKLHYDGDTADLPDGRTLRLRILPDQDSDPFNDTDLYGRIEWCSDRIYDQDGRLKGRPDGFDGNAEKMWAQQNGDAFWWQPPADVKRSDPNFSSLRSIVNDLASFGMVGYVVDVLAPDEHSDFYDHRPVLTAASLWGIECMVDGASAAEIVADLVSEVLAS